MPQPTVAGSPDQLLELLRGIAHVEGDRLVIDDEPAFRARGIRDLAWTDAFSTDAATVEAARWIVWRPRRRSVPLRRASRACTWHGAAAR